jgi:hypothetical protein
MIVTLELDPDIEASLNSQAKAKGLPLDAYLRRVIEDLGRAGATPQPDLQEFRAALDRLADMGKKLPGLTSSAFSRESIYQDHD